MTHATKVHVNHVELRPEEPLLSLLPGLEFDTLITAVVLEGMRVAVRGNCFLFIQLFKQQYERSLRAQEYGVILE